jgi:hypothetical protein
MAIVPSHVFSVYMLVVHICSINRWPRAHYLVSNISNNWWSMTSPILSRIS